MSLRFLITFVLPAALVFGNEHAAAESGHPAAPDQHETATHVPASPAAHETPPAPSSAEHASAPENHAQAAFSIHPPAVKPSATPEEIASLLRIGLTKLDQEDYVSSELAFRQVLAEKATKAQDLEALMGLARTYRKKTEFTKAAAVYETIVKNYPEDPLLPTVYLELGRTLRALGTYKTAIARFYNVINSTLKLPEENADLYRQLARTAQFEIAETHFQAGEYDEANRYFARLKLLDLAPEDRARAHFKSIYALTLMGEHEKAISGFRAYLDQNPNDENTPEARYLLATSYRALGRYNESLAAALELLRAEKKYVATDPKRWTYWQRKTGNQLANQFFEQGDFGSSLVIYQNLESLSPEPGWRLPVLYQIGLCNERLHLNERAREAYETIIANTRNAANETPRKQELVDLFEMAESRLLHLFWMQKTQNRLSTLFPNEQERVANLANHEPKPDGSAEKPSSSVR